MSHLDIKLPPTMIPTAQGVKKKVTSGSDISGLVILTNTPTSPQNEGNNSKVQSPSGLCVTPLDVNEDIIKKKIKPQPGRTSSQKNLDQRSSRSFSNTS